MREFSRADRLSSQIARELSEMLLNNAFIPPNTIISITEVELSKDLRYGKIYYSAYGDDQARARAENFFKKRHKQIRMELAGKIHVRFVPELKFIFDPSMERGQRINELLDRIKKDDQQS